MLPAPESRVTGIRKHETKNAVAGAKPADVIYVCTRHPLAFNVIKQALLAGNAKISTIKPWSSSIVASDVGRQNVLVVDTCSVERWSDIMVDCREMNLRVVLLVPADEQDRLKSLYALNNGADGIVAMSTELDVHLPKAIQAVVDDHLWMSRRVLEDYVKQTKPLLRQASLASEFTTREEQIISVLKRGLSNRQIAKMLGISERTVKFHVSNILRKSQIGSRKELVLPPEPDLSASKARSVLSPDASPDQPA